MTTQRRKFLLVACAFFVAIALPTLAHAQKTVPLVILGGTLIDATGRPPLENRRLRPPSLAPGGTWSRF